MVDHVEDHEDLTRLRDQSFKIENLTGLRDQSFTVEDLTGLRDQSFQVVAMDALNCIEADKSVFQLYASGVLTGNCRSSLENEILLADYGIGKRRQWLCKAPS
jgi:hypothetical protein